MTRTRADTAIAGSARRGCAFCHLRAELDEALARVGQLEAMLQPPPKAMRLWPTLGLTSSELVIMEAVYALTFPPRYELLLDRLEFVRRREISRGSLTVIVCRLRKKLAQIAPAIEITPIPLHGYGVTEDVRSKMAALRAA